MNVINDTKTKHLTTQIVRNHVWSEMAPRCDNFKQWYSCILQSFCSIGLQHICKLIIDILNKWITVLSHQYRCPSSFYHIQIAKRRIRNRLMSK